MIIANLCSFLNYSFFNIYNNYFFYLNFLVFILVFIMQYRLNIKDFELIIFILLFIIYGLATLFITGGGFGSIIISVYSIIAYWAIKKSKLSDKYLIFITIFFIILNVYWVINSPGSYVNYILYKESSFNSNTVGSVLLYTSIYSTIFIRKLNWKWSNFLSLVIYVTSFWGIINTRSRGSLIVFLIFIILDSIFPKKIWRKRGFTLAVSFCIIIFGVMFTYIYLKMYLLGINIVIPIINKPLFTGREIIWKNFYDLITQNYISLLFGLGSKVDLWKGQDLNLHNGYLTVITNFGIIGFLMYYAFWIKQIRNIYRKGKLSEYQVRLILVFLCVLLYGYIEVSILWHVMFFFNFMCLGLACSENDNFS